MYIAKQVGKYLLGGMFLGRILVVSNEEVAPCFVMLKYILLNNLDSHLWKFYFHVYKVTLVVVQVQALYHAMRRDMRMK